MDECKWCGYLMTYLFQDFLASLYTFDTSHIKLKNNVEK